MTEPESNDAITAAMEGLALMREMLRGMVAGLTDDGFTEEQARAMATASIVLAAKGVT